MKLSHISRISANIEKLFPGGLHDQTKVSAESCFGAMVWKFSNPNNVRLSHYKPSDLTIDWGQLHLKLGYAPLSENILHALKLFCLLYFVQPSTVVSRATKSKNHPSTVCQVARSLVPFIAHTCEKIRVASRGALTPQSLATINAADIRRSLLDWPGGSQKDLRRALLGLTNNTMQVCLGIDAPGWSSSDLKNFDFKPADTREDYERVLPNALFQLISNCATDDICGFLKFVGHPVVCDNAGKVPPELFSIDGPQTFAVYIELRRAQARSAKLSDAAIVYGAGLDAKRANLERCGVTALTFHEYLHRVRNAAGSMIALYTGARYSDLIGLKVGCLEQINSLWFIRGSHIKHEDIEKPIDEDTWAAIPILRDAVACLELLSQVSENQYLICSLHTNGDSRPYSPNGFAGLLKKYIQKIDECGNWSHIIISPHRCRHTLAHQLARADLGLVLISYHLKHLHTARNAIPASETLLYGGISQLKVDRAVQAQAIQLEMAKTLYDPDAPISGGGAEEFRERRKQYFVGMIAAGHTKDQIIVQIASQGIQFSSVGMGYCNGRREIHLKDGTVEKPPCLGSLQCSPDLCKNAIITKAHVPVWQKVVSQNCQLAARPDMAHARSELLRKADVAKGVLADLEEKINA